MAYEMVMPYHLHMPSYFLETFTEYPYLVTVHPHDLISQLHASQVGNSENYQPYISCIQILKRAIFSLSSYYLTIIHTPESA